MSRRGGGVTAWQDALVAALRASNALRDSGHASPAWSRIGGNALTSIWSLALGATRCFVKVAEDANHAMLAAEADALHAIAQTGAVRVPRVIVNGRVEGAAFLALEWLDLADGGRDARLASALARMHATTARRFGWHRDNTIGTTPQANAWCDDWATFFRDRRLAPQLELAALRGLGNGFGRDGERLLAIVPRLLEGHRPAPCLLHGDLWAGNAGRLSDGTPVLFDPATYFGDRETDLAMAELFGGFEPSFRAAYVAAMPLPPGYETRRDLYNLYHVLNHLNLFGPGYLGRAKGMLAELLAVR